QFLRGLRGQFPGGLREMLERIGPEAVEDVLGQVQGLIVGEANGEEGMPGAFAGAGAAGGAVAAEGEGAGARAAPAEPAPAREELPVQEQGGEQDEDEEEEEEPTVIFPGIQRIFRNVLGRFWNGVVGVAGDSSSDEDDALGVEGQGRGPEEGRGRL
ncbi:hypothetical protein C0993_006787, partial [Termitomyces sp. T159_Od127]